MTRWDLAGYDVGLVDALTVVAPFWVPDVLVLEHVDDAGLALVAVPKLAHRFDFWLNTVDHADYAHRWPDPRKLAVVEVGSEKLEGAVGGAEGLPVLVVEFKVEDAGKPKQKSLRHEHLKIYNFRILFAVIRNFLHLYYWKIVSFQKNIDVIFLFQ